MKTSTKYDIALFVVILGSLLLGGIIGYVKATENLFTCAEPRLESTLRTPEKAYYVYSCADGEYRTYKAPLDNQIEGDGVEE